METIGIMLGLCRGYIEIMENKMETTIIEIMEEKWKLLFRV